MENKKKLLNFNLSEIEALLLDHTKVIDIKFEGRIQVLKSKTHEQYALILDY